MKKAIAFILAALLLLGLLPVFSFAEETGEPASAEAAEEAEEAQAGYHAEEVVYGVLGSDGSVEKLLPVVVIDASEETELSYYGDFDETRNLSDTSQLQTSPGAVKLKVPAGRFYFESLLNSAELPWDISISYSLDGKSTPASELGGASGALEIKIDIKPNPDGDKSFFDNYLLQIGMTMDSVKCRNIEAEGATMANAGSNKMINFMAMPGMESSFKLSADVSDFSMAGISIAAVPVSMADMLNGMGGITEGIDDFGSALTQLSDGVSMLAGGAGALRDGFGMFAGGLIELSNNSAALVEGSEQILAGLQQISSIVGFIQGLIPGSGDVSYIPQLLYDLADTLDYAALTLGDSKTAIDESIEYINALLAQVADIPEEELTLLWEQCGGGATLEALISDYRILIAVRDNWSLAVENFWTASEGMGLIIEQLSLSAESARTIAAGLEGMVGSGTEDGIVGEEVSGYLDQLAGLGESYGMFHEGLVLYTGGVDALAQGALPLYQGTDMLASGTEQLDDGTSQIPEELADSLSGGEFVPHSFLSDKNENVKSVQFVFSTEAISLPEPAPVEEEAEPELSGFRLFIKRLTDLFK